MTGKHRIVVSTENNAYSGWQCKLFYQSCLTRTGQQPLFVVHSGGGEWHPDFDDLVRTGALVHTAPCYAQSAQDRYVPRNGPGTLLHAADCCQDDEFIVLCDPDMIFVRQPAFPEVLSGDHYSHMDYDRPEVKTAAGQLGLPWQAVAQQGDRLCCGVPYVIPVVKARRLAQAWFQAIDAFPPRRWEDGMYAFGLAAAKLEFPLTLTQVMETNSRPDAAPSRDIIHYCHGDETWNKRHFYHENEVAAVWWPAVQADRGTILGEILAQIAEAREFYGTNSAA